MPNVEGTKTAPTGYSPEKAMIQMLVANRIQQAIYVAAKFGIADLLRDGPKRSSDLARTAGLHPGALYRLLRALAAYGIFAECEPNQFTLTPLASMLQKGVPGSLHPVALWNGSMAYQVFSGLEYSVRTGEPSFDHMFGMEFFDYLSNHPDTGALFDEFMARQTAAVAAAAPIAYDFSDIQILVDVGGGRGELIAAVLRSNPRMRGVLFDRPSVADAARSFLLSAGIADRCAVEYGDISNSIPVGGDAYLLKSIVHSDPDDKVVQLLKKCRAAMNATGRILLIEYVIPPGNDPHPGKLMDVLMLLGTHGGHERTQSEFQSLLASAGFRLTRVVPTDSFYSIIEGRPC
jgi:hypothetical protein